MLSKFNLYRLPLIYSSLINTNCFSELLQTLENLFSFCPESNGLGKSVVYSVQLH